MSPKNKHFIVLVFLIVLALFVAHSSSLEKPVSAQNVANVQFQDIAFNAESVLIDKEFDVTTIQIPIPWRAYQDITIDDQDEVLVEEGTLDEFIYLPIIDNNFVYVFDDFSDPNSGFPIADTSTNTYQYTNGEYQILNKTDSYLGAVSVGHKLEEFEFEVSMRRVGSARGFYGIVFWLDETWNAYYLLMISPDTGEYYYYRYQSSSGFTLLAYSGNYQYINLGNAVNRIGMKQYWAPDFGVGILLEAQFTINGYTASFSQATLEGVRRVGFFAAPIDANHQVHFDDYLFKNYCILYPGCSN